MKRTLSLIVSVVCLVTVFAQAADLSPIPFRVTSQKFKSGDRIVIREVLATSPRLKVGDTVIVRGEYHLESKSEAALGFFLTTNGPSGATRTAPEQRAVAHAGTGSFELKHVIPAEGRLHVSFYPRPSGSSFGGVYFGPVSR